MKKNLLTANTFLYKFLYPAHIIAILSIFIYPIYYNFGLQEIFYMIIGWFLLPGIGSAITLHRAVSHRSIEFRPWFKIISLWLASMCLQGSPLGWAAVHRGSHHRYSDTDRDAHTPKKGWFYSYHLWLYKWNDFFNPKYVIDLINDKTHLFFAHNYEKIIFFSYIIIGIINWKILIFMFIIPAVYSLHQESLVNLFCHLPNKGYRNFVTKDNSNNRLILSLLFWGQAFHNNHHHRASSYDFGTSVSGNKLEFDMSLIFVPFIATKSSREKIFKERKNAMENSNT